MRVGLDHLVVIDRDPVLLQNAGRSQLHVAGVIRGMCVAAQHETEQYRDDKLHGPLAPSWRRGDSGRTGNFGRTSGADCR